MMAKHVKVVQDVYKDYEIARITVAVTDGFKDWDYIVNQH